jgi:predicted DCC family thiol-disulfide oxidoreductase YuxK
LYDGQCNLCHRSVQWVVLRDKAGVFRFAALGSGVAGELLAAAGHHGPPPDSVVLISGGRVLIESDAAIGIADMLGWPWRAAAVARWMPRRVRDGLYRFVARRRYGWFGRAEGCLLMRPEWRGRFLDDRER